MVQRLLCYVFHWYILASIILSRFDWLCTTSKPYGSVHVVQHRSQAMRLPSTQVAMVIRQMCLCTFSTVESNIRSLPRSSYDSG